MPTQECVQLLAAPSQGVCGDVMVRTEAVAIKLSCYLAGFGYSSLVLETVTPWSPVRIRCKWEGVRPIVSILELASKKRSHLIPQDLGVVKDAAPFSPCNPRKPALGNAEAILHILPLALFMSFSGHVAPAWTEHQGPWYLPPRDNATAA